MARGLGRGYGGLFVPHPRLVWVLSAVPQAVEGMLWAGTHPSGHKLEKRETSPRTLGPLLTVPRPGQAGRAGHSLYSAHSDPGSPQAYNLTPCPGRLNVPSPDRCFGLHFGEGASDSQFPGVYSGSGACALGGALLTPTAEFAGHLGLFERTNFRVDKSQEEPVRSR